jgi:hypothetical protein
MAEFRVLPFTAVVEKSRRKVARNPDILILRKRQEQGRFVLRGGFLFFSTAVEMSVENSENCK